jgi:endonuclease YncB( thermonuclease family)
MSHQKPSSLLHALAAIAIVILSAVLGLKHSKVKQSDANNYQQVYLPVPAEGANQNWPEYVFSQRIEAIYPARVIRIVDGDTVELLLADNSHPNIRLASIDAPERGQPYGAVATDVLQAYVGKLVTVLQSEIDRYGRPVAFVIDEQGLNINVAMIQSGYAWHYSKYSVDPVLQQMQQQARGQRLGLWQDQQPIAPDQWRQLGRSSSNVSR